LGSFEAWADLVAGAVAWAVGLNPITLIEERKAADPRGAAERALITALTEKFPENKGYCLSRTVRIRLI
jgi:hypothetical protein